MRPTEIHFEYDADDRAYSHGHVLDVSDDLEEKGLTMHEFLGQIDAGVAQLEATLEQQFAQAGLAGVGVDFETEAVDEAHLRVESSVAIPADVDENRVLGAAVSGEVSQLLNLLSRTDPDLADGVLQFVYGITQANPQSNGSEE